MKPATRILTMALLATSALSAQDSVDRFRYRPETVSVGTVYHYVKSNLDGSQPERVSIYVASPERIESFKYREGGERAALVVAEMSWETFSPRRMESWQVFADRRSLYATIDHLEGERAILVDVPGLGRRGERVGVGRLPFHVYNFDLASLNFAFRHLADPRAGLEIGIVDPTFRAEGPMLHYKGEAEIGYEGEEARGGVACRKYRIGGDALENRGGFFWVSTADGHFVDVEIELPDHPEWESFKFRLTGVARLDPGEWEAFVRSRMEDDERRSAAFLGLVTVLVVIAFLGVVLVRVRRRGPRAARG